MRILGAAAVVLVGFALSMMGQSSEPDTSADAAKLKSVPGMVSASPIAETTGT